MEGGRTQDDLEPYSQAPSTTRRVCTIDAGNVVPNRVRIRRPSYVVRKEESGDEELPSTMEPLCHSVGNGGFPCASSPVHPHNECRDFNNEVDPVAKLLEDSNAGVFVASRHVELMSKS